MSVSCDRGDRRHHDVVLVWLPLIPSAWTPITWKLAPLTWIVLPTRALAGEQFVRDCRARAPRPAPCVTSAAVNESPDCDGVVVGFR